MPLAQVDPATASDDRDDEVAIDPLRRSALLEDCSGLVISRLSEAIAEALAKVGDDMTALALRNTDRVTQQALLDAVTLVRCHHADIELHFREMFSDIFARRVHREADGLGGDFGAASSDGMALVDDSVIEEKITIDRIIQRARSKLDPDEVLGIRARLGVLAAGDWFDEASHPASPEAVFEALRRTLAQLEAEGGVRDALLDAIEPHVSSNLGAIYSTVNERLRNNQVLPKIRPQMVAAQAAAAQAGAGGAMGGPAGGGQAWGGQHWPGPAGGGGSASTGYAGGRSGPMALQDAPAEWLQGAGAPGFGQGGHAQGGHVQGGHVQGGHGHPGGGAYITLAPGEDPFEALSNRLGDGTRLARLAAARLLADPASFSGDATPPVVESALLQSLHTIQSGGGAIGGGPQLVEALFEEGRSKGSPLDQLTMEIVALVFDHLYADRRLPDTVKQQLLRLQVVAVKAALIDRSFFASRRHPMRRLLDEICRVAGDPDADTGADSTLVSGVAEIVDWLITSFENDLSVFEDAGMRLDLLLSLESQKRAVRDDALARQGERMEALGMAQEQARAEIRSRVDRDVVPAFLIDFLDRYWYRAMALLRVEEGDAVWEAALATVDALAWSVSPKTSAEIPRLAGLLPKLIGELGRGLGRAEVDKADQDRFFNELLKCHTEVIQRAKSNASNAARRADAPAVEAVPRPVRREVPAPRPAEASVSAEVARQLGELHRGDTLELLEPDGMRRRYRISWISPIRRLFVLSCHPDVTRPVERAELARWFATGRIRVADAETAVERTIATIAAGKAAAPA